MSVQCLQRNCICTQELRFQGASSLPNGPYHFIREVKPFMWF
ncbi:hypothetical protein GDO86_012348 [Hymenochirus boettgeri]|uniref:Uncharacterized protein n=1 Tax=Hymenochirus boettgeri TaxID=247094 RepID=A0A8T2IS93_9PIPI|nr:hypothetical protein GDO86_012348 [Hymenochirus boettgeri]